MNEDQFKAAYIAQFLASYMASRYDKDCQTGHPNEPYNNQPVEDAAFLAKCAWGQIVTHLEESKSVELNELFKIEAEKLLSKQKARLTCK